MLNNLKNFYQCLKKEKSLYVIEDFGLKFNYLNDVENEPSIFRVLKCLRSRQIFKSRILDINIQKKIMDNLEKISVYKGNWIKYKKNISDICFLELKKQIKK